MLKLRYVPVVLLLAFSAPATPLDAVAGQLWDWLTSWTAAAPPVSPPAGPFADGGQAGCGMDPNGNGNGANCG